MVLKTVLKTTLGVVGNATAVCLFVSPIPTFLEIRKRKSTEDFSSFPYISTLANCILWVVYGILKGHSPLILTINGFGCFIELIYLSLFWYYAPTVPRENKKFSPMGKLRLYVLSSLACILPIIFVGFFATHHHHIRMYFFGVICAALNSLMNLSPLSIMYQVYKTKSTEYMPFYLSLFVFLNSIVWLFYALVTKDWYIFSPNIVGLIGGAVQLVLYLVYRKHTNKTTHVELTPVGPCDIEATSK